MGKLLAATMDFAGAGQEYRQAIQIARAKFKGPHTITANALFGLGSVLLDEHRPNEAKEPLTEALEIRQKLLPSTHPAIAEAKAALARCTIR